MRQRVKQHLNHGETKSVEVGRRIRQECCMFPILLKLHGEYYWRAFTDFKTGGRIINKVRFADDMVIIAMTQEELQCINRSVELGIKLFLL
jgi:Reverse transcriptase (RNA-dependent DNA polymerase).